MTMDAPAKPGPPEHKTTGPADAGPPKPDTRVYKLREYVALLPLLLLSAGLSIWLGLHAKKLLAWYGSGGVLLGVLFPIVWKAIPKATTEGAWSWFSGLFRSRALANALWMVFAAFIAATLLVSTLQVTATDLTTPLTMYRYTVPSGGQAAPLVSVPVDSLRVAKASPSGSFFVMTPFGKRAWIATSGQRQSKEVRVYPWIPTRVMYPDDFASAATLAVLPTGSLLDEIGKPQPPRLIVATDSASGSVLAEDTLATHKAVVFSFGAAMPADSLTRRAWMDAVRVRLGADSAGATQFVNELFPVRPRKTGRPLASGERLRVFLVGQAGDTVASDTVTLQSSLSHVFLRRRP